MKKRVLLCFILCITQLCGCSNHASEKNEIISFGSEPYSVEANIEANLETNDETNIGANLETNDETNTGEPVKETETKAPETHKKELPAKNAGTENTDTTARTTTIQPEENETEILANENRYSAATDIPRAEVENYAAQIKQQFLQRDWTAISSEISYPITISGTTYNNSTDFLDASDGFGSNLAESFFAALEDEDCLEMFCSWEGIMLGETGQVWIGEVLDEDLNSQGLKIIAMNGLFTDNQETSNSAKWNNAISRKVISDYETELGCHFEIAQKEFEDKLQGIWQVKEFVGWDASTRYQWGGGYGNVVIFCENAWIYDGSPYHKPVYACHTVQMNEIAAEDFFNIEWSDDRYKNKEGLLTLAVCTERNKLYGEATDGRHILFVLFDDVIIMERNGSYWELEKVGDVVLPEPLENVEPS